MAEPLSIYALIADASLLVQIIMALLAAVSIASWVMNFQRW
jgi:biopolymer transport protein TolQ